MGHKINVKNKNISLNYIFACSCNKASYEYSSTKMLGDVVLQRCDRHIYNVIKFYSNKNWEPGVKIMNSILFEITEFRENIFTNRQKKYKQIKFYFK